MPGVRATKPAKQRLPNRSYWRTVMSNEPDKPVKPEHSAENPVVKLLIDLGPLVAFFLTYAKAGIFWATGVLMAASLVALVASRVLTGRFALAPAATVPCRLALLTSGP